jgi:LPS-assembly protein
MSHASAPRTSGSRFRSLKSLLFSGAFGFVVAASALGSPGAWGAEPNKEPVLLNADTVTFDEQTNIVTARGNVELSQGNRSARADTISYNRNTRLVTASGNVRVVESSGDILFADYAELTDDLRDAFVDNIRILMTDNARLAGAEGERQNDRTMRINRGVYSPCDLCKDEPAAPPLWQIKAVRIVHDREKKEVRYKDARLELFGVPIAYTPYFSHPDPTVKRRSGVLAPGYGRREEMGFFVTGTYYADLAPDKDATISVSPYSEGGVLLNAEYRQQFENGRLTLDGALTRAELISPANKESKGQKWRGRIGGRGLFDIDETWRWGFNVDRTSDIRFPYNFLGNRSDILTSRAFVEGFRGRNYASLASYSFQDLRYGNTTAEPIVAPQAVWNAVGDPGSFLGGRLAFNAGVLSLYRSDGPNSTRVSFDPSWQREFVSSTGLVATAHARLLLASYGATDYARPDVVGSSRTDTSRFRAFPEADITLRYPLAYTGETFSHVLEPIVQLVSAANIGNAPRVPNEDSLDFEFDETNLFQPSRYAGIDRLDGGTHVSYGLRSRLSDGKGRSLGVLLGQSYRVSGGRDFPANSGLDTRFSDVIGRIDADYSPWFNANYSFRVTPSKFEARRQSLGASLGTQALRLSTRYTLINKLVDRYGVNRNRTDQITYGVSSQFSQYWRLSLSHQQAFWNDPGPRSTSGILTYRDECFTFDTVISRDYTKIGAANDPGVTAYFRLVFKNLGEFKTPEFAFGSTGQTSSN